jgi:hypothetical protein
MKLELLNKEENVVTQNVYTIQDEDGVFYYKEWLSGHKVVDAILMDRDGYQIDDAELLERVEEFIDSMEN